jgi:hypothetical protein
MVEGKLSLEAKFAPKRAKMGRQQRILSVTEAWKKQQQKHYHS